MKHFIFFCLIACWPAIAASQSFVNPDTIYQSGDIYLQNTDVYYCPFAPPAPTDTRQNLCNLSVQLNDPNGVGNGAYLPITHGVYLQSWHPCSSWPDTLGPTAVWQRLFTAKCKPGGLPSEIIVGDSVTDTTAMTHLGPVGRGEVTISANEDVDFRASGGIRMENGFHVMPGAFFHAYIEPKWGDSVFSDEFDSTALDRSRWVVGAGWGDPNSGAECSSDSNVHDTLDPDAHDGHALDVFLREMPPGDTCSCLHMTFNDRDNCLGDTARDTTYNFRFSSAVLRSCPGMWLEADTPFTPAYQHAPYGKYEIREKIPHIMHETNNWGFGDFEWDMGQTYPWQNMAMRNAGFVLKLRHGPFNGKFGRAVVAGDTLVVFRSSAAHFSQVNNPTQIFIDNFAYAVAYTTTATDTFLAPAGTNTRFVPSLANDTTDFFSFNYERQTNNAADNLTWTVRQASDSSWRIFSAAYHDSSGYLKYFTIDYQPTSVTLKTSNAPPITKTFNCKWKYNLNDTGSGGLLWLNDTMSPLDLHSNTEPYPYIINEGATNYPIPPVAFDGNDTVGGYVYHTYTMELLPHEMIYLVDGNVVRRFPDRLVPVNSPYYDRISSVMRYPAYILPAELEIDPTPGDPFGIDTGSVTFIERQYFESHLSNPGMWDVTIDGNTYHAAHHLVDYVKIWDVPSDVQIPNFPH